MAKSLVQALADQTINCHPETLQSFTEPWLLGPFDQLLVAHVVTVESVFVYQAPNPPTLDSSNNQTINQPIICPIQLQHSLNRLLDFYPQLTGRFEITSTDHTPQINKLGSGALYRTARCERTLDSFKQLNRAQDPSNNQSRTDEPQRLTILDLPEAGSALWCPFDMSIEAIGTNHILTVQHTVFACGSVSLGVRVHHWACDAEGYFVLMEHLHEIYEQSINQAIKQADYRSISLKSPPVVKSYMAGLHQSMSDQERQNALQYQPKFFLSKSINQTNKQSADSSSNDTVNDKQTFSLNTDTIQAPITGRVIRFSAKELKAIKQDAMEPIKNDSHESVSQSNRWVSTFEALTAHLHQRIFAARAKLAQSNNQSINELVTDLLMPMNFRSPQRLNLSSSYFPNADIPVFTKFTSDQLLDEAVNKSLREIALSIHSLTRELTTDDVVATMKWISAQPDKHLVYQPFRFPGGFMVTQWSKMNMYKGMTFNKCDPILVSKPFTVVSLLDGFAHFMATEEQLEQDDPSKCGIDVVMSVNQDVWQHLDSDPLFRRHSKQ